MGHWIAFGLLSDFVVNGFTWFIKRPGKDEWTFSERLIGLGCLLIQLKCLFIGIGCLLMGIGCLLVGIACLHLGAKLNKSITNSIF